MLTLPNVVVVRFSFVSPNSLVSGDNSEICQDNTNRFVKDGKCVLNIEPKASIEGFFEDLLASRYSLVKVSSKIYYVERKNKRRKRYVLLLVFSNNSNKKAGEFESESIIKKLLEDFSEGSFMLSIWDNSRSFGPISVNFSGYDPNLKSLSYLEVEGGNLFLCCDEKETA